MLFQGAKLNMPLKLESTIFVKAIIYRSLNKQPQTPNGDCSFKCINISLFIGFN